MVEAGTDLALLKGLADKLKVSIATELATSKPSWPAGTPGATYLAAVPVRSVLLYLGLMALRLLAQLRLKPSACQQDL